MRDYGRDTAATGVLPLSDRTWHMLETEGNRSEQNNQQAKVSSQWVADTGNFAAQELDHSQQRAKEAMLAMTGHIRKKSAE